MNCQKQYLRTRTARQASGATGTTTTTTATRPERCRQDSTVGHVATSDGQHVAGSYNRVRVAILAYLEKMYYEAPCTPRSPALYVVAQSRLHESNDFLSVVVDSVVHLRRLPHEKRNSAAVSAKWASVEYELRLWESYLDGHQYVVDPDVPYLCDFTLFINT